MYLEVLTQLRRCFITWPARTFSTGSRGFDTPSKKGGPCTGRILESPIWASPKDFRTVEALCWARNYQYMKEMELEMRRFLKEHDFTVFKYHGDLLRTAFQTVEEEMRA